MPTSSNKYLDLTGLTTLVNKIKDEDAKKVDKASQSSLAHNEGLYKVTINADGLVTGATSVTKSDITALQIPEADTNQKIKSGSTTFGNNDVIDIVAGSNISVTPDTAGTGAPKITIAYTGAATDRNQTVKSGSVEFGADDVINIKADTTTGNPITVTGDATSKEITIKHGETTAVGAAAVKVGYDKWGHVVLGSQLEYSDLKTSSLPTIGDKTLTITAGSNSVTFSANQSDENKSITITAADLGLDSAMHFIGVSTTDPVSAGATVSGHTNWLKGDVVLYGNKEYVLTGTTNVAANWKELGDEGSYALKTTQIIAGNGISGGGALSGNVTISHATTTAVDPAAKAIGYDQYGHVVIGTDLTTAETGAHTHTVTGSVTVPTISSSAVKLELTTTNSDEFIKSYAGATSKLVTTSITGVSGSTTASKATAGTEINYGTADVGTAVKYGTANVKSTGTVYGTANVSGTATTVVTSIGGTAYSASYDSENSCLNLTALTPTTDSIHEAVAAPNTQVLYEAVEAPSNQTLTPAKAADSTRKIIPYTFTDVTVPKAASSATTVATGSLAAAGAGDSVMTGLGTATKGTALASATLGTAVSGDGDVTVAGPVTVGSTTASLASGTAVSNGAHTHTINGGKII